MDEIVLGWHVFDFVESETGPTMNAHDFINYELEVLSKKSYITLDEEILGMFDEKR
jgi:hypothetical protein